ncbi:beta-lactamase [Colletotrichum plurivorum]|uniref:Beta-lactamase n=1 Tax=Colletotrichum plurivorum TaxID=2175906 RepID=A0A8H6JCL4_9PEZI|nr:beta-lactamase [Colletotrichum plurivorum]
MTSLDDLAKIFSTQTTPPQPPEIFLSSHLGVPSVSVAVLDHGEIEARCFSTLGDDEHTRFQAASISKPTAATAVMRLVAQGKLSLDDKVMHHLPDELLDILGPREILAEITLRHLLTHTAGFRTAAYSGYAGQEYPSALDTLMDRNGGHNVPERLTGFPGQEHAYCGGGFAMLQIILEKIFKRGFAELMQELVFDPLEMGDSTYEAPDFNDENTGGEFARSWWTGTQKHDTPWHHHPELASGGLWTTPTDLLKLIRGIQQSLKDDTPEEERFLPKEIAKEMLTQVQTGVAVSWFISRKKGNVFGHFGGNSPCFRCYVVGFADPTGNVDSRDVAEGCGVAVMTNGLEGTDVCCKVVHAVAHFKGWPYVGTLEHIQEISVPVKDACRKIDGRWEEWIGEWEGGWRIEKSPEGGPMARFGGLPALRLVPVAMPAERGEDGGMSIDLLVEGLQVMLRLPVKDGRRAVEVWSGLTLRAEGLERKGD